MIDFEELDLEQLVVHKIGNKMRDEGIEVSEQSHDLIEPGMKEVLLKFFLRPFREDNYYQFTHEGELDLNEVYFYTKKVFSDNREFYNESIRILKHLYEKSNHPNIKSGEFYMAYFRDHSLSGKKRDVIGVFKTENRDTYLKVNRSDANFIIQQEKGINIDKLDKGCLIINDEIQDGFKVLIVDASAKSQNKEAHYWKNSFLNLKEIVDEQYTTNAFLKICNSFSASLKANQPQDAEINETIRFNHSTLEYFEQNDSCSVNDFLDRVFDNEEMKDNFVDYKARYEEKNHILPIENFNIEPATVVKLKKKFMNTIKLDTGFELKVTDNRYLEKGYDSEKGMSFYKIFFHEES
ncbi:nucleoid-associated protein [Paenibacillus durus]|uniref:Nucleoid-associated protein NdpA n=1 Tax=Paenibacillus durus TaxID=44251 RepID=A0A089HTW7_PAEDU|nr:nucleoid-associated protein [Paenibacillus durus]AIQ13803.1 hypothetical protein PDUR_19200 [Paenibacillus durus]